MLSMVRKLQSPREGMCAHFVGRHIKLKRPGGSTNHTVRTTLTGKVLIIVGLLDVHQLATPSPVWGTSTSTCQTCTDGRSNAPEIPVVDWMTTHLWCMTGCMTTNGIYWTTVVANWTTVVCWCRTWEHLAERPTGGQLSDPSEQESVSQGWAGTSLSLNDWQPGVPRPLWPVLINFYWCMANVFYFFVTVPFLWQIMWSPS